MDISQKIKIQHDTIKQLNEEKELLRKENESLALQLIEERRNKKEIVDAALKAKTFYEESLLEMSNQRKSYEKMNNELKELACLYKKELIMLKSILSIDNENKSEK